MKAAHALRLLAPLPIRRPNDADRQLDRQAAGFDLIEDLVGGLELWPNHEAEIRRVGHRRLDVLAARLIAASEACADLEQAHADATLHVQNCWRCGHLPIRPCPLLRALRRHIDDRQRIYDRSFRRLLGGSR